MKILFVVMVVLQKLMVDRGKLNTIDIHKFFKKIEIKIILIMAYNLKAYGKSEYGHVPIMKILVKAYNRKVMN